MSVGKKQQQKPLQKYSKNNPRIIYFNIARTGNCD